MAVVLESVALSAANAKTVASVSVRAGDLIIVGVSYDETLKTATCADGQPGTYTQWGLGTDQSTTALISMHLFYKIAQTNAIVTVTVTTAAINYTQVIVHVVSGIDPVTPLRAAVWGGFYEIGASTYHGRDNERVTPAVGDYLFSFWAQDSVNSTTTDYGTPSAFVKRSETTGTTITATYNRISTAAAPISQTVNSSASTYYANLFAAFAIAPAKPVVTFSATPSPIPSGNSSTLSWTVGSTDTPTISIDQSVGTISATGTTSVSPTVNTTYTLTATNATGTTIATAYVGIAPASAAFQVDAFQNDAFQINVAISYNATRMLLMF